MPKGVVEEEVVADAQATSDGVTVLVIIQLVLQFALKGSIDDLWSFFLIMQLIAYMSIYETPIPANIEIYVSEFRKLVKFEILKPDNLLGLVSPGLTLQSLIESSQTTLSASMESSGVQSSNFFVNMAVYIGVLLVFIVALLAFVILRNISKLKKKVEPILQGIIKKTFWNNIIRSVSISYLETAISLLVAVLTLEEADNLISLSPLMLYLVAYPTICTVVLLINFDQLGTKEMQDRIGKMYVDISLTREHWAILFYPVFIFRRLLFVMIPLCFQGQDFFQLQFLIFFNSLYIIFYAYLRPHIYSRLGYLEIINEFLFLVMSYHFLTFTLFNIDISSKYSMGFSYLAWMALLILLNFVNIALNSIRKFKRRQELKRLKKAMEVRKVNLELIEHAKKEIEDLDLRSMVTRSNF